MRRPFLLAALVTSVVIAGCIVADERPTGPHEHAASSPRASVFNDPTSIDTGDGRLPDSSSTRAPRRTRGA